MYDCTLIYESRRNYIVFKRNRFRHAVCVRASIQRHSSEQTFQRISVSMSKRFRGKIQKKVLRTVLLLFFFAKYTGFLWEDAYSA